MDIPTKVIETPQIKTKVTLKEWITGGDFEDFQKNMLKDIAVGPDGNTIGEIKASVALDQNHKAIELVVVEVDGVKENILKTLRDLPKADYQFVIDAVNEVTNPKATELSDTNIKSS